MPNGATPPPSTLSGLPTEARSFTFTVQVADSATPTPQAAPQSLTLTVLTPLLITTPTLLPGKRIAYSQALGATGGATPYLWSLATGSLPPGLTLNPGGAISGTPTGAGSFTLILQVADSGTPTQATTQQYTISIVAPLGISTNALPTGLVGAPYAQTLSATGGATPYTWSIISGSLPAGLMLNPGGTITGTPTTAGSSIITLQVTDAATQGQQTVTRDFTLTIVSQLVITTTNLAGGLQAVPYAQTLAASGGTTPYTWSISRRSTSRRPRCHANWHPNRNSYCARNVHLDGPGR